MRVKKGEKKRKKKIEKEEGRGRRKEKEKERQAYTFEPQTATNISECPRRIIKSSLGCRLTT